MIDKKTLLTLLCFFTLAYLVSFREWLFSFSILSHGDWYYYPSIALKTLRIDYFGTWLSDVSFGRILIDLSQAPTYWLYGIISKTTGLGFSIIERLVHLWPAVIIAPVSSYVLSRGLFNNSAARLATVIMYTTNTYFLVLLTGHITLAVSYAAIPIYIHFCLKTIHEKSVKNHVYSILALAFISAYETRVALIAIGLFAFICIISSIYDRKKIVKNIGSATVQLTAFVLLSAFWAIPALTTGGTGGQLNLTERSLFGDEYFSIIHSATLFHPFWNFSEPIPFIVNTPPVFFWALPFLAILGIRYWESKNKIIFTLISCVGILLAKQSGAPFQDFYSWLFENIPLFSLFREASKFYILVAIGYSVLIGGLLEGITLEKKHKYTQHIILSLILFFALLNLSPLLSKSINTTFEPRDPHDDYAVFSDYISNSPQNFSRVLWVPNSSRYGYSSKIHPRVQFYKWSALFNDGVDLIDEGNRKVFTKNIKNDKLFTYKASSSSTSRLVVPVRDLKNDDDFFKYFGDDRNFFIRELDKLDWLERIDIGTDELVVYENKDYLPYFTYQPSVTSITELSELEKYFELNKSIDNDIFSYIDSGSTYSNSDKLEDIFESLTSNSISSNLILAKQVIPNSSLITKSSDKSFTYKVADNSIQFRSSRLAVNNPSTKTQVSEEDKDLSSISLASNRTYFAYNSPDITALQIDENSQDTRNLGAYDGNLEIYSTPDANYIVSEDFSEPDNTFSGKLEDCNPYDNSPLIDAYTQPDEDIDNTVLELRADRHTACIGPDEVNVNVGETYRIGFDYKLENTKQAGYIISFNDEENTEIHQDIYVQSGPWRRYDTFVNIPEGATKMKLKVLGFPDETRKNTSYTSYDNFQISKAKLETTLETSPAEPTVTELKPGELEVSYTEDLNTENLVPNPSLEDGLWREQVGDCNAYDDNPKLDMSVSNDASDGSNSLKLNATRHIACTGPEEKIPVQEGSTYLLEFDYKGNGDNASYYIGFNDSQKTTLSKQIPIENGDDWSTYSEVIEVPYGATELSLSVYSYSDESTGRTISTLYDNFSLVEVPNIEDMVYLYEKSDLNIKEPKEINFELNSPTKKTVSIKGASGDGFYLAMSESYHPKWRAIINNGNTGWTPWKSVEAISDDNHFELNGWQNGWYIDVNNLCIERQLCTQNEDGTWNIDLIVEFSPQRWFYVGSIISGTTFIGMLGYLGYDFVSRRRNKRMQYENKAKPKVEVTHED